MVGFGDLEGRVGDIDDGGAVAGVGDQSAGVAAEEIDAEIELEYIELLDDGLGGYFPVVDGPGVDVPALGGRGRRVTFDGHEERGGGGVEDDVGGR